MYICIYTRISIIAIHARPFLSRSRQTTRLAYVVARTWTNVMLVISSTIAFITVELVSAKSKGFQIFANALSNNQKFTYYSDHKFNATNVILYLVLIKFLNF